MATLFISGINDSNTASLIPGRNGRVHPVCDGSCGIYGLVNLDPKSVGELILFGEGVKQEQIRLKSRPTLVFNQISDPDSHQGALKRCESLCARLQCPIINHPSKILQTTRDNMARLLHDIPGLKVPKTIRFIPRAPEDIFTEVEKARLEFPVIVRLTGSHGGKSCTLVAGRDDLHKLHVYPFDGSDFYLTEFVDYASDDGYYRKYRIVVIDGVPLFRHHKVDKKWMVHAASRLFMEEFMSLCNSFDEEMLPVIRPAINEITRRLQLEYYGIDCNIDAQGNILIFEVNANMNVLENHYAPMEGQMQRIRAQILKLLDKHASRGVLYGAM